MAWQDELRDLDADVASGAITAADYRTRRDELLVLASDSSGSDSSDGTAAVAARSDPPAPSPDPFPPAFRWSHGQPPAPGAPPTPPPTPAPPSRAGSDRPRRTGPGPAPWVTAAGLAERPSAPRGADVFDESPPPPYRLVTALVLTVVVVALVIWLLEPLTGPPVPALMLVQC